MKFGHEAGGGVGSGRGLGLEVGFSELAVFGHDSGEYDQHISEGFGVVAVLAGYGTQGLSENEMEGVIREGI